MRSASLAVLYLLAAPSLTRAQSDGGREFEVPYPIADVHLHLTDYVQEGPSIRDFLKMRGKTVGRVAIFGIPLQQEWSWRIDGENRPDYYLRSDAHLYYYSFTDAFIAMAYRSLSRDEQAHLDPMITGFNPADLYAADHIKRVLQTFPGVFSGIGEFSIHKEFVSASVAGDIASLNDPALDRVLDFAAEAGLVVLIHNDIDTPFPPAGAPPRYLDSMKALIKRHPKATVIWAHTGLGRVIKPPEDHLALLDGFLKDPSLKNLSFDLSWSVVAEYFVATPETQRRTAALLEAHPDRFLFGTDALAPKNEQEYLKTYRIYRPLWALLTEPTRRKVLKENYERIFDDARRKVRAWERAHPR